MKIDNFNKKIEKNTQYKARTATIKVLVSIMFIVFFMGFSSALLSDGLVSHYRLDETSGTVVVDAQGRSNAVNNETLIDQSGIIGRSYYFDSNASQYLLIPDADAIEPGADNFTISFWAKVNTTDRMYFFHWSSGQDYSLGLDIQSSGTTNTTGLWASSTGSSWDIINSDGGGNGFGTIPVTIGEWTFFVVRREANNWTVWQDGELSLSVIASGTVVNKALNKKIGGHGSNDNYPFGGYMDDIRYYNRSITNAEITSLYELGFKPIVNLISPEENEVISSSFYNFTSTGSNLTQLALSQTWKNITYYVWNSTGDVVNQTFVDIADEETFNNTKTLYGLSLGDFEWNVLGCYSNTTASNCTFSEYNNSFSVGATINEISYNNKTFETATETFSAEFDVIDGSEISLAQLIYNGTSYTITDISLSNSTLYISKEIDIPLNINSSLNQTNEFYFIFNYAGGSTQSTETFEQEVGFINLVLCGGNYTTTALNFTLRDETTLTNIDPSENPTSFESSFDYWLGTGSIKKDYSYQLLNDSSKSSYQFCIYPYLPENYTFKADLNSLFSAEDYSENEYYLRNATLTNSTSEFELYLWLLDVTSSTKFYVTVKQGITFVEGAIVNVAKFFIGEGLYKTVSIKITDEDGKFPFYADIDSKYLWSVYKDGEVLGIIEKTATCAAAPCSIELNLEEDISTIFTTFDDYYASNIVSSLVFDPETRIVTYTFLDTTGLAQYFRLKVSKMSFNGSIGTEICDINSYSTVGILTCNLTGYEGDFFAYGYISRSPELLDEFISFVISDAFRELGFWGILLNVIILITMIFISASTSRGNPSVVIFILGVTILLLKIGQLFPFSWTVVIAIEVGIVFLLMKVKS